MTTTTHLHPGWFASFVAGDEQHKTGMLQSLVVDWLHGTPPNVDHCGALVELISHSAQSSARRALIDAVVGQGLVQALAAPSLQHNAAVRSAAFLHRHPPAVQVLLDRLLPVLSASGRPSGLLEGLERLAGLSRAARLELFPVLFEATTARLLDGRQQDFVTANAAFSDLARLRGCLETSPYQRVLTAALAPPAAADEHVVLV
jgi:hypothetical protein